MLTVTENAEIIQRYRKFFYYLQRMEYDIKFIHNSIKD